MSSVVLVVEHPLSMRTGVEKDHYPGRPTDVSFTHRSVFPLSRKSCLLKSLVLSPIDDENIVRPSFGRETGPPSVIQ